MQFWKGSSSKTEPPPTPPKTDTFFTVAASMAASAMLFRSVLNDLIPDAIQEYFSINLKKISNCVSSQLTVVIEDYDGFATNQMFQAASVYLGSKLSPTARRIKVNKPQMENELAVTIDTNQEMVDLFKGVKMGWVLLASPIKKSAVSKNRRNQRYESRHLELSCHKKYRDMVLSCYLPYILRRAKEINEEKKTLKLHYNGTDYWGSVNFDHPANFDTIAMDVGKKQALIEDLNRFVERKEYYRRVGRAWKRGYLFYGPSGTGKSSLVAAIANYLKFDLFDLDLKEVRCDSDLRRLLIGTKNRSILVIEDIDRTLKDIDRTLKQVEEEKVTLAGLLNFIDGLWSSCGDERIIVFTTNNKDQLDPALLRPGRMDVHIEMSYCTFVGFKILANNYLRIQYHALFEEIEELLGKVKVTPAAVAGELMKSQDPDVALQGLILFLQNKQANNSAQKMLGGLKGI